MPASRKQTPHNIRYIVVHSSKTLPHQMYIAVPYHFIIHRDGTIQKARKLTATDGCIQVAYLGGIDANRIVCDTKTPVQNEILFAQLTTLSKKYPNAKIVGANEVFGELNHPGFEVGEWLKKYKPSQAAKAA